MAFSDLEDPKPEEAYAETGNANDGAGEEEKHQEEEDDVVNGKDFGRVDEDPIDRVEDVDMAK